MANLFICFLYVLEGVVFGILAFVLKRKRSEFPDFRVGYHDERWMTDKDRWNYANRVTGNICLVACIVFVAAAVILYCCKVALGTNLIVFCFVFTGDSRHVAFADCACQEKISRLLIAACCDEK